MASPETAYRNSAGADRQKTSASPFSIVTRVTASTLPPRLRNTLAAMLKFNQFGTELWPATFAVRLEADISYRTAQRHIDQLVKLKVLQEVYPANTMVRGRGFRRSATYRLDANMLTPRQSYKQWLNSQPTVLPIRPQSEKSPAPPKASPTPLPDPKPTPPREQHRRKLRQLTSRERGNLVQIMTRLMRGQTRIVERSGGYGYDIGPEDPQYIAPIDQNSALLAACKQLLIPIESAIEALKLAGFHDLDSKGHA